MDESQVIEALGALAHEARLRILRYLVTCGPEGAAAGAIGAAVEASSSRASFHLAVLSKARLITSTRVSRSIIYRVEFAAMGSLMSYLVNDCCQGHKSVRACC